MRKKAKTAAPAAPQQSTETPTDVQSNAAPLYGHVANEFTRIAVHGRKPHAGQQVWFVRAAGPPGTILGTESDRFVAWIDAVYEAGSEEGQPFVDLTYHTRDERGAAVGKNVPHDLSGSKDCSWCYREDK